MRKEFKNIERLDIYGDHHWIEIEYGTPEWNEEEEPYFNYKGNKYFLSEILAVNNSIHNPNPPEWQKGFDGYMSDSFFSGILVKFSDCGDAVQVYTVLA